MSAAISLITILLVAATLMPFLRIAHGFVRVFSFPRLQILTLTFALTAATLLFVGTVDHLWPLLAGQGFVATVQAFCILPFTPLWKSQSKRHSGQRSGDDTISILSFNVKMSNRHYDEALALAERVEADIAVFMETDAPWCEALMPLAEKMPHVLSEPLDNSYGMILFSRLPLRDAKIDRLLMEDIPSMSATVSLRDGRRFRFHAVHPEPPVPYADSAGRDGELMLMARIVAKERLPTIVTGDLNDVAWSHTTRLFQRVSRLLDPRIGRGFYNTFDARFWFMRWPLDHLFHDARFALIDMERLPACGSDHFPMLFRLALTHSADGSDLPEEADETDHAEASDIIAQGKALEREAIGTDWET